jgi:hypothetical protein
MSLRLGKKTRSAVFGAVSGLCLLALPAWAQAPMGEGASLRGPEPFGMAALYDNRPDLALRYHLAMLQYRWTGENGFPRGGYPILDEGRPFAMPWLWADEDGRTLRRMGNGVFRLATSSPQNDLFAELECYGFEWPNFFCTDGQERTMAAPDLSLIVFDGKEYRRVLPANSAAEQRELP